MSLIEIVLTQHLDRCVQMSQQQVTTVVKSLGVNQQLYEHDIVP
jgi:hypothetical protein